MGLLIYIMVIATCIQCLNLAGYEKETDLKKSDKRLFVLLPFTVVFWLVLKNQNIGR